MSFLSSLLACLGCSSDGASARDTRGRQPGSSPPKQPDVAPKRSKAASAKPSANPSASAHAAATTAATTAAQKAVKQKQQQPPAPSRQPSRGKLDLPLEYVQDPQDDPEDSIIMGRKASFSLGDSQSSTQTSRANSSSNLLALASDQESHHTMLQEQQLEDEVRLLGPVAPALRDRKCLVLDLDETLVHSSFKYMPDAEFIIPVEIDGRVHNVYVAKRPGVDEFLRVVGSLFELVVFTASVAKYGDPLLDHLDAHRLVHHRLFRESCYNFNGNYIKNLSQLGRPLKDVIIIDNSPASYALQPQNAVPVSSWFSDAHDNELLAMLPFLRELASREVSDVSAILDVYIES